MTRVPIKEIMKDPVKRKKIMIRTIIAIQAREGITTSYEQAEAAYNKSLKGTK